jgi:hypothetical protein
MHVGIDVQSRADKARAACLCDRFEYPRDLPAPSITPDKGWPNNHRANAFLGVAEHIPSVSTRIFNRGGGVNASFSAKFSSLHKPVGLSMPITAVPDVKMNALPVPISKSSNAWRIQAPLSAEGSLARYKHHSCLKPSVAAAKPLI